MADHRTGGAISIRREGLIVHLFVDDHHVAAMPYEKAILVANALKQIGLQAEQRDPAKVQKLIKHEAMLIRQNLPIGLAVHQDVRDEAYHAAQNDDTLRRNISEPNIPPTKVVRAASVTQTPPKVKEDE